jgi:hypothetical protein
MADNAFRLAGFPVEPVEPVEIGKYLILFFLPANGLIGNGLNPLSCEHFEPIRNTAMGH